MAYLLEHPFSEIQRANFIVKYNHVMGLEIKETKQGIYAILPNEKLEEDKIVVNSSYKHELEKQRKIQFEKDFFYTSLGWIRKKEVTKGGSTQDFIPDILLQIKAGLDLGLKIYIPTYNMPDFSLEIDEEYLERLKEKKHINKSFVKECLSQIISNYIF